MEDETINWIPADWPAPGRIRAGTTNRRGGCSRKPFDSFNLALHVGDDSANVRYNRDQLIHGLNLPSEPIWIKQVHGSTDLRG